MTDQPEQYTPEQEAEKYRQIINLLKNKNVPEEWLDRFTVGDTKTIAARVQEFVFEMYDRHDVLERNILERILLGGFGTGKTHFLNYVQHLLKAPREDTGQIRPDIVISRVDMSNLREGDALQYLIIRGLQNTNGENYTAVLDETLDRLIATRLKDGKPLAARLATRMGETGANLLNRSGIQERLRRVNVKIPGLDMGRKALRALGETQFAKQVADALGERRQALFELRQTTNKATETHLFEFLELCGKDYLDDDFAESARRLSRQGTLTDIMFKVFSTANYRVVVLLIDELEALKSLGNAALQKVMTALRALRDSFSKVASAQGYPSIAFIAASTGSFFEEITQLEPALSSRWSDKGIPLNSALSDIEFEYLARELRSLYKRADWQLRSLGDNDIPLLREEVNGQLAKEQKIGNMREVIKRIMDYIEDHWQR